MKIWVICKFLSLILIAGLILAMTVACGLDFSFYHGIRLSFAVLVEDLLTSFLRVTIVSLIVSFLAVLIGKIYQSNRIFYLITHETIHFLRHISPFVWIPFAIIWFGLGEAPVVFVLSVSLFFPAVFMIKEIFAKIPQEYIDEAQVCGSSFYQQFILIELPVCADELVNVFRIVWGMGWTIIIAVEMLGVQSGLGYRLLDFRYLLKYPEMIIYIIVMGVFGIIINQLILFIVRKLKGRIYKDNTG